MYRLSVSSIQGTKGNAGNGSQLAPRQLPVEATEVPAFQTFFQHVHQYEFKRMKKFHMIFI